MKVTNLNVTKLKDSTFLVETEILQMGHVLTKVKHRSSHSFRSIGTVQEYLSCYNRSEVSIVVAKDSWLNRCRTARPGSLVLSLRWDGATYAPLFNVVDGVRYVRPTELAWDCIPFSFVDSVRAGSTKQDGKEVE